MARASASRASHRSLPTGARPWAKMERLRAVKRSRRRALPMNASPSGSARHWRRFNPRPRAGGDRWVVRGSVRYGCFNPRPRAGGDLRLLLPACPARSFNPRPRAGGDVDRVGCRPADDVSIHAPARGATRAVKAVAWTALVSIHAPARGATEAQGLAEQLQHVSIHAPARGATETILQAGFARVVSIHAPARGATWEQVDLASGLLFQSTPPRGGRPARPGRGGGLPGRFNPRPRAGGDSRGPSRGDHAPGFNPRPRAGGDRVSIRAHGTCGISVSCANPGSPACHF